MVSIAKIILIMLVSVGNCFSCCNCSSLFKDFAPFSFSLQNDLISCWFFNYFWWINLFPLMIVLWLGGIHVFDWVILSFIIILETIKNTFVIEKWNFCLTKKMMKYPLQIDSYSRSLLDIFGDGLGSFWDSVSGEFSWEDELDSRLNFSWGKSSSFVESNKLWSFSGNSVEGIMDERVHNVHGLFGNTNVWVDLLKDFVDIDGEGLDSSSSCLLVSLRFSFFLAHYSKLIYYLFLSIVYLKSFYYLPPKIYEFWLDNLPSIKISPIQGYFSSVVGTFPPSFLFLFLYRSKLIFNPSLYGFFLLH